MRYRRPSTGKENFHSLGPYPEVSLVEARKAATTARNLVREGTDPVEHRRAESAARKRAAEGAFHLVAQKWLAFKRKEWADETYRKAEFVVREYLNWLRVSLERKRDVKKRCSVGAQERFESCEKGDSYAILSIECQDCRLNGHDASWRGAPSPWCSCKRGS